MATVEPVAIQIKLSPGELANSVVVDGNATVSVRQHDLIDEAWTEHRRSRLGRSKGEKDAEKARQLLPQINADERR